MSTPERAGETLTERPAQTRGFVRRGRCEACAWPHHERYVFRQGWFSRRVMVFVDLCSNCHNSVEVWRG